MSNEVCRYFLQGNCTHGDRCRYQHSSAPNTNDDRHSHHHREGRREHDKPREERQHREPHDYASVQTQMEIIAPGINTIIDIAKLTASGNEALISQLFKLPAAKQQQQQQTKNDDAAASSSSSGAQNKKQQKPEIILALDFHGVTDIVASTSEQIFPQEIGPICVVSYVGPFGEIRERTRQSLIERVENNQIQMGIMVFKKIRDPAEKEIPPIEFVASKRHAVELLMKYNGGLTSSGRILFVDDSKDNVATVDTLKDNRVKCALFKEKTPQQLKAFLVAQIQS